MAGVNDQPNGPNTDALNPVQLRDLEWSLRRPRSLFNFAMSVLTGAATIAALLPLFSVLYLLVKKGIAGLTLTAFTDLPPAAMSPGGGFGNAIVGTFVIVAIATFVSVPFGKRFGDFRAFGIEHFRSGAHAISDAVENADAAAGLVAVAAEVHVVRVGTDDGDVFVLGGLQRKKIVLVFQ